MKKEKEPEAIRELHRIREQMLSEEKRVGRGKYWAQANEQAKQFARRHGLKYVEPGPSAATVREKRAKYKAH
jgi:hypothetical protein